MATDFDRAKVLDFHAAACADALQHYPDLSMVTRMYLANALLGSFPEDNPKLLIPHDDYYHPVRCLLLQRHTCPSMIASATIVYARMVEDGSYDIPARELPPELEDYTKHERF